MAGFPQLILTAAGWAVTWTCGGEAQNPRVVLDGTPGGDPGDEPLMPQPAWQDVEPLE